MNRKTTVLTQPSAGNRNLFFKRVLIFLAIIGCYGGFVSIASNYGGVQASIQTQNTPPQNVILLIGDGMSQAYLDAASIYASGTTGSLFMETAPHQALMGTNSRGDIVTDSAASASAMATGHKVFNGVVSMSEPENGQELETSLEHLQDRCKSTGLVGTSYINHATAGAFGAHATSRTKLDKIANDFFTKTRPNVLFGGAAAGINPEAASANNYTVVQSLSQLNALIPAQNPYVSGQFATGHMGYEYDDALGGASFYTDIPHLSEMTRHAINLLSQNNDGFFLMAEGSRIDHAGHENHVQRAIFEMLEFDKTVREVVEWASTRNDTLVIVTADHDTGGLQVVENKGQGEFPEVSWSTFAHTEKLVPVFAWGVGAELVSGQIDNTDIYHIVTANSGDVPKSCDSSSNQDAQPAQNPAEIAPTATPTVTPTATLTPTPAPTSTPTNTPTPTPIPDFRMDVGNSPRAWVEPGEEITYAIQYAIGNEELEDVVLFSRVPDGVELIRESLGADSVASYNVENFDGVDTIEWRLGSLSAYASGQVEYQVRRLSEAPINETEAGISGANAIAVTKVGPDTVDINQPITYILNVTNTTDVVLADIFVVDAVPFGATYIGGADAPPVDEEVSWWIDLLQPQETRTLSYSVMASTSLMTRGFKVYNPEGIGVTSYEVISTVVNDTPMPFAGDGVEIVNNGVWATWYHHGQLNVGRAEPAVNPTFDFYMPLLVAPE